MNDELLLRRLRANASWGDDRFSEAADRIEQLTAERDANGKDYCALMERYDALVVNNARLESTLKDRAFILEEWDRPQTPAGSYSRGRRRMPFWDKVRLGLMVVLAGGLMAVLAGGVIMAVHAVGVIMAVLFGAE